MRPGCGRARPPTAPRRRPVPRSRPGTAARGRSVAGSTRRPTRGWRPGGCRGRGRCPGRPEPRPVLGGLGEVVAGPLSLEVVLEPAAQSWPGADDGLVGELDRVGVAGDQPRRDHQVDEPLLDRVDDHLAARHLAAEGLPPGPGKTRRRTRSRSCAVRSRRARCTAPRRTGRRRRGRRRRPGSRPRSASVPRAGARSRGGRGTAAAGLRARPRSRGPAGRSARARAPARAGGPDSRSRSRSALRTSGPAGTGPARPGRPGPGRARSPVWSARRASTTRPRPVWATSASKNRSRSCSSSQSENTSSAWSTSTTESVAAAADIRASIGWRPGREHDLWLPSRQAPRRSPARSSEDLPLPDGPTTASRRTDGQPLQAARSPPRGRRTTRRRPRRTPRGRGTARRPRWAGAAGSTGAGVLTQDRLLERDQVGTGVQPQVPSQDDPDPAQRAQRLRLPSGEVLRLGQQRPAPLPQRRGLDHRRRLGQHLGVVAGRQRGLDDQLLELEAHLARGGAPRDARLPRLELVSGRPRQSSNAWAATYRARSGSSQASAARAHAARRG